MDVIIMVVGGLLVTIILFLIFRTSNLVNLIKGKVPVWESTSNRVNAVLMLVFLFLFMGGFWWYFFYAQADLLPESASEHGLETDSLFNIVMAVILIPFVLLNIFLFWAAYRFRYNKNRRSKFHADNNNLELAWTIIPSIVFTILILRGVPLWDKMKSTAPEESELVEIMGFQFGWKVRYPGLDRSLGKHNVQLIDANNEFGMDMMDPTAYDDFITNEIHVPKGQPVLLRIWSRDVIHSVFAPHFRLKQDAVPGMLTTFWFEPRLSTEEMRQKLSAPTFNYEIACTEVCGRGHFSMRMIVVVDEPDVFEKWKRHQNSWLKSNPEYMAHVPENLRELAQLRSGMDQYQEIPKATLLK
ncbi:MAG: cytochrome c oxidase subunit II [Cyclobacteriaceae bacterium]|nr:cytochrome c oxidase subunit II [Cyclobacteriaceae bacterium]